jgi:hypothetical protein
VPNNRAILTAARQWGRLGNYSDAKPAIIERGRASGLIRQQHHILAVAPFALADAAESAFFEGIWQIGLGALSGSRDRCSIKQTNRIHRRAARGQKMAL